MHPNAEVFRALADGRLVLTKPPYGDDFIPLGQASSTALHALHNPVGTVPAGWEFKVAGPEVAP